MGNSNLHGWKVGLICAAAVLANAMMPGAGAAAEGSSAEAASLKNTQGNRNAEKVKHHPADYTGKKRLGKASFYAREFAGRKMANGVRMDPKGSNAASKTLPLGTTAKVTNLQTGKSAVVTIQDRGPYVPGRIVDLSPATAQQIGLSTREGVASVVVAPITVPQPDGRVKVGAAVTEPPVENERLAARTATKTFESQYGGETQHSLRTATADASTYRAR
jgi:rare lipoprotein A